MADLSVTARREILESDARFAAFWWGSVILTSLLALPVHYLILHPLPSSGLSAVFSVEGIKFLGFYLFELYPFVLFSVALPFGLLLWLFAHMAFELFRWLLRRLGLGENGAALIGAGLLSLASAATA